MTGAQACLGALVLLPLLAAALSVLLPHTARRVTGVLVAVAVVVLTVPVVTEVAGGAVLELGLAGHQAPLGIMLRADGLSALFVSLTGVVGLAVSGYAALMPAGTGTRLVGTGPGRSRWEPSHPGFWPLWLACWSGLNAVFVSGDLFNTYVGLELASLSAVGLVALGGRSAWPAALRYLFIAVLGSLLFLVAVGLLVSVTGTLDLEQSARVIAGTPGTHEAVALALALASVGLGLKVAIVPLHRWLIPAHSSASSAVSPLLSALVIKASLFVVLRCWIWLAAPGLSPSLQPGPGAGTVDMVGALGWVFGALGVLAVIHGSVMAIRQDRLKPLVAYSTVAQVGYWLLFFPLVMDSGTDSLEEVGVTTLADDAVLAGAVSGTVALALGHGLAKAGLFLSAGFLKDVYGTDVIDDLRGAGRRHPMIVMTMGLSAVGLAGLPLSLGFTGKWQLATAAVASGHYWMVVVLVLGTLLSAAYLLKAIAPLLIQVEDDDGVLSAEARTADGAGILVPARQQRTVAFLPQIAPFALGTLTVLTGLLGAWTTSVLGVGAPW